MVMRRLIGVVSAFLLTGISVNFIASAAEVKLRWTMPTNNVDGSPLTNLAGATVCYGTSSSNYSVFIDVGLTNSCTIKGLVIGATYFFNGKAYNTAGLESDFGGEVPKVAVHGQPMFVRSMDRSYRRVTPESLDFGTLTVGDNRDLTLNVKNIGGGMLIGSASVPFPFRITTGGTYSLGSGTSQTVIVRYSPAEAGTNGAGVTFSDDGAATYVVVGRAINAETIVDNTNASSVAVLGVWTASTWAPAYHGGNYFHDGSAGKGTKSVTFRPNLPVSGQYAVYLWWPAQQAAYAWANNVPVDIVSSTGTNTVMVNQKLNGNTWFALSTNTFTAGTAGCVKIRTDNTDGAYVIADAVRFVQKQ